jgi:hypothetical protein
LAEVSQPGARYSPEPIGAVAASQISFAAQSRRMLEQHVAEKRRAEAR